MLTSDPLDATQLLDDGKRQLVGAAIDVAVEYREERLSRQALDRLADADERYKRIRTDYLTGQVASDAYTAHG